MNRRYFIAIDILWATIVASLVIALIWWCSSCSMFKEASIASTQIKCVDYSRPKLPGEYYYGTLGATDINTGPPLFSTPHRAEFYCKLGDPNPVLMPESSAPNIFSSLENIPSTLGSMVQGAAPAAAVAH